ncbi:hypothetical protein GGS26DRAFT_538656 [Hypomontagnella submonticulosa]|nr:hypothetical protein GGS26DRAFT_538656 [Hypomontagnella submonticulosa]
MRPSPREGAIWYIPIVVLFLSFGRTSGILSSARRPYGRRVCIDTCCRGARCRRKGVRIRWRGGDVLCLDYFGF